MRKLILPLAASLVIALIFALFKLADRHETDQPILTATKNQTTPIEQVDLPSTSPLNSESSNPQDRQVDFESIKQRLGVSYDPMLIMALGDYTDEEIDSYNELHILPFNPVVGRECQSLPDAQLIGQTVTKCTTIREYDEHPYNQLDIEALTNLAVTDAVAALVLGRHETDEDMRLAWYLRATALSEKPGEIMSLAERRYSSAFELKGNGHTLERVARPKNIIKRLALETVADKLGDPRAKPEKWIGVLKEVAGENAAKSLQQSDEQTKGRGVC